MTTNQPNPVQTTDAGIPVQSDKYSLTVGAGGPILLQDSYLIEQMANFNRERIKERQPHAKGSGAFGRFEVTGDVSAYTSRAPRPGWWPGSPPWPGSAAHPTCGGTCAASR
jgi:catalase